MSEVGSMDVDAILETLAAEVRDLQQKRDVISCLLQKIEEESACFSTDEIACTQAKLAETDMIIESKLQTLSAKIDVYEKQISVLETQLKTRKEVLESASDVVDCVPDLINIFTSKHAQLLDDLSAAKRFMRD